MFLEQFREGKKKLVLSIVRKKKVETYAELAKDPSHPCGKPYTVEVTIEGIAPLLMQRWDRDKSDASCIYPRRGMASSSPGSEG